MNSNPSNKSSALLGEAFGQGFKKFEAFSNDLESELIIEEKRLVNAPATAMFLTMSRKIEVVPHREQGFKLHERWILRAAQVNSSKLPQELLVDDAIVEEALGRSRSPIVAVLEAHPDWVADLRLRFDTFNAVCERIELKNDTSAPGSKTSAPRPRL